MKRCRKCGRWLPLDAFPLRRNRHGKPYRPSPCRDCTRLGIWVCRQRQREAYNAANRAYYATHRAAIIAQKRRARFAALLGRVNER